jgi:hypothetical protein
MKRLLVVLAVALLGAGPASAAGSKGTIEVIATRGPVTPVCAVEVPCDGPAAGVRVVVSRRGVVVARGSTNRDGRARLLLLPGRYVVTALYGGGIRPQSESAGARVVVGRIARVRFAFDTGIR